MAMTEEETLWSATVPGVAEMERLHHGLCLVIFGLGIIFLFLNFFFWQICFPNLYFTLAF